MFNMLLRSLFIASAALWLGCTGEPVTVCETPNGTGCNDCLDGEYTCTYDGVSVTTPACAGCQTRLALIYELCAEGRTESRELVEAEIVCEGPFDTEE